MGEASASEAVGAVSAQEREARFLRAHAGDVAASENAELFPPLPQILFSSGSSRELVGSRVVATDVNVDVVHASDSTPATEETAPEDPEGSPVVGAGWCVFRTSSKSTPAPVSPEAEEEEPVVAEEEESASGCDAGIGVALYRMRRLALVGVLGSKSLGFGLGWIIGRPMGRTLAVAMGYVCSWSSQGIESDECRPALGATLSLARAGQ